MYINTDTYIQHTYWIPFSLHDHYSIYFFKKVTENIHPQILKFSRLKNNNKGFPGGTLVKNLPANVGDTGSNPGSGRSHMQRSN